MKNLIFSFFLISFISSVKSQSPTFTLNWVGPTSITCKQTSVKRYAVTSYTAGPVTYSWVGLNATYTGSLVTIGFPGNYTVTEYAGTSPTYSTSFNVNSQTSTVSSTISPLSQTISCGLSSVSTVTVKGSGMHTFVSPFGSTINQFASMAVFTPSAPGTYTHILEGSDGCESQNTFTVVGNSFPTFSLVSPQNFSLGCGSLSVATVSITQAASSPPGSPVSYTITNLSTYSTGLTSNYIFNSPGHHMAIVKDNITGCETKVRFQISQNTVVVTPFIFSTGTIVSCAKKNVWMQYIPDDPGNYTSNWIRPNNTSHSFDSIIVPPTANISNSVIGTYSLVTTNLNNLCKTTKTLTIYQSLFPPKATIIASPNSTLTCISDTIVLSNWSTTGIPPALPSFGPIVGLAWNGPAPQTSLALSSTYLANTPGIYSLTAWDTNNGCTSHTTILISDKRDLPQIISPTLFDLCHEPTVTLSVLVLNPSQLTYLWKSPTGNPVGQNGQNQLVTATAGQYTVFVTNISTSCTAVAVLTVGICIGLEEQHENKFLNIYPNPAKEFISIRSKKPQELSIWDVSGKLVLMVKIEEGENELDITALCRGVYFLRTETEQHKVRKIVKIN